MTEPFPMPHRLTPFIDSVIASIMLAVTSSSTLILADNAKTPDKMDDLLLLLLPLIGALIVSGGVITLNPKEENRKKIMGRCSIAVFFAVVGPSSIALLHPALAIITNFPALLLMAGGLIFMLIYILSKPIIERFYSRSDGIAEKAVDEVEQRFIPSARRRQVPNPKNSRSHE